MVEASFTAGLSSKQSGYIHVAAAAAMQGLTLSQYAERSTPEELAELSYALACGYVRAAERIRKAGVSGISNDRLPLVFKHALIFLSGAAATVEDPMPLVSQIDQMIEVVMSDTVSFVQVGDSVNEALRTCSGSGQY